jgi:hypothetical protein
MAEEKNIKNYSTQLWIFIAVNFSIYITVILEKDFSFINNFYSDFILQKGFIAAVLSISTFALNGIISSQFKAKLVFWKIENPYPGCRVFTKLIDKDPRIDKTLLINKYKELPTKPESQNSLWYKIYKNHQYDPMVFNSHRNFLIARDLTALSFSFLIIYTVSFVFMYFSFDISNSWIPFYTIFLISQYIGFSVVARHYGKRFACNVIAKEYSVLKN